MAIPTIITGDDVNIAVTLTKNNASFTITGGGIVKARLVAANHCTSYSSEVTQSRITAGADWANALVIVVFPASSFNPSVPQGPALLEVQVEDSSTKLTWFVPVSVVTGNIA